MANPSSGHQRNPSQGQHLIVESGDVDESTVEGGRTKESGCCARCCADPRLRANIRVVLGSIVLTIVGAVLLAYGTLQYIRPEEGVQAWVFLFAGCVCFVPGSYHVYYIVSALCGRPGYSFDRLPTFNR